MATATARFDLRLELHAKDGIAKACAGRAIPSQGPP